MFIEEPLDWIPHLPPAIRADPARLPAEAVRMQGAAAYLYRTADQLRDLPDPKKHDEAVKYQRTAASTASIARGWTALTWLPDYRERLARVHQRSPD